MPRKKKKPPKAVTPRLAADNPAARDEGPRLLPIDRAEYGVPGASYYLDLADQALGAKKSPQTAPAKKRHQRSGA